MTLLARLAIILQGNTPSPRQCHGPRGHNAVKGSVQLLSLQAASLVELVLPRLVEQGTVQGEDAAGLMVSVLQVHKLVWSGKCGEITVKL